AQPVVVLLAGEATVRVGVGEHGTDDIPVGVRGAHRRVLRLPRVKAERLPEGFHGASVLSAARILMVYAIIQQTASFAGRPGHSLSDGFVAAGNRRLCSWLIVGCLSRCPACWHCWRRPQPARRLRPRPEPLPGRARASARRIWPRRPPGPPRLAR